MLNHWKTASAAIALALSASPTLADVAIGVLIPSSGKGASYGQQQQMRSRCSWRRSPTWRQSGQAQARHLRYPRRKHRRHQPVAQADRLRQGRSRSWARSSAPRPRWLSARGARRDRMMTPMAAKAGIAAANRPWAFRFALTTENVYRPLLDAWLKPQSRSRRSSCSWMPRMRCRASTARPYFRCC